MLQELMKNNDIFVSKKEGKKGSSYLKYPFPRIISFENCPVCISTRAK